MCPADGKVENGSTVRRLIWMMWRRPLGQETPGSARTANRPTCNTRACNIPLDA